MDPSYLEAEKTGSQLFQAYSKLLHVSESAIYKCGKLHLSLENRSCTSALKTEAAPQP